MTSRTAGTGGWTIANHRRAAADGVTASARVAAALDALAALDDPAVLIGAPLVERALEEAARLDGVDPADLPLHGVPFVVKDNIDVAGVPTTAACPGFAYVPAADATAVARLRAAGAVVVGKANLDQFATGLVGTRSPYGTPRNPHDPTVVPGGSSSGSAVAVARGLVPFALGTDTAGSGRVPAALCGIVGCKGTLGRVSTTGVVPAVRRIDCTTVFAASVGDAALVLGVAGGYDPSDPWSRRAPASTSAATGSVGVPERWPDGLLDDATAECFERTVATLRALGHDVVPIDLEPFLAAGALLYGGPLVAERLAAVGAALAAHPIDADPTVAAIIRGGVRWSAADAYETEYRLAELRRIIEPTFAAVDALALPTTPGIVRLVDVAADAIGVNERLGRLTTFANLLDLAAVAVPAGLWSDGLPASVQLVGPAWSDDVLLTLAAELAGEPPPRPTLPSSAELPLVVVGAHLRGEPLNGQLAERGARLLSTTTTAPSYRLFALRDAVPPKPALVRDPSGGAAIAVEVWSMPIDRVGSFLSLVPPPLCLGTIELADGSWHKGFLCEPRALDGASEITSHGGWRAYRASADGHGPAG